MSKKLYIIRHGETEHNRRGIVQGRGIDSHLNNTGKIQAELFFQKYKNVSFECLFCSDQKRTYQTISSFESSNLAIIRDTRLDEISWGEHEGKSGEPELMEKYYRIIQSWSAGNYYDRPVGGESAQDLHDRVASFIMDLSQRHFNNALIATHGRTLRAMLCILKNQPIKFMDQVAHQNTGLYMLEWRNKSWEVLMENDCEHLGQKIIIE